MKIIRNIVFFSLFILINHYGRAQVNIQAIEIIGQVTSSDGKGIPKVAVTDGINIVETDEYGKYFLLTNGSAQFIYISIPSGYKVPFKNNTPSFYQRLADKTALKQQFDFELEKLPRTEDNHRMIVWADPQVYNEDELNIVEKAGQDVSDYLEETEDDIPTYGVVLGDIVGDANAEPKFYEPIKQIIANTDVPFFYALGNHDLRFWVRSNEKSKDIYMDNFGPPYYSFNRGKIHYIVLDNCFYIGNTWNYIGYLPERQLEWLSQDLSRIPEGSTVVVMMHIPTYSKFDRSGASEKESKSNVLQNRNYLFNLLAPFNVHIISGHMHEKDNFIIRDNIFEHNEAAISALFYDADWCGDGTPRGYGIYEFKGSDIRWCYKALGESVNSQFKLYNIGEHHQKPEGIVVNVWNYDPEWKVVWYENDIEKGEMKQFRGQDTRLVNHIKENKDNFKHSWSRASDTDHLFYAVPETSVSNIKIKVTDRFGRSYIQEVVK